MLYTASRAKDGACFSILPSKAYVSNRGVGCQLMKDTRSEEETYVHDTGMHVVRVDGDVAFNFEYLLGRG